MIVFSVAIVAFVACAVIFIQIDPNIEDLDELHHSRNKVFGDVDNLATRFKIHYQRQLQSQGMMRRRHRVQCQQRYEDLSPGFVDNPEAESATKRDPEIGMTACEIAQRWGYPCQNHSVTTKDGYILTVHRIPHGRNINRTRPGYPVLLQHGLTGSSVDWIINLPNQSLGFILADQGYDVWMGNFRGNYYSRRHTSLNPDSRPFWEFSLDQMASQDLPAMINYVLKNNNNNDLFFIAHSQGTSAVFAEFSKNNELSNKVKMFFALAPVTTVGHIKQIVYTTLAPFAEEMRDILYDAGFQAEVFPRHTYPIKWLNDNVCSHKSLLIICKEVFRLLGGFACADAMNITRIPVYNDHTPAGTSLRNFVHLGQLVRTDKFQKYDYGSFEENRNYYGQDSPPQYDISAVRTPLAVYWGGLDPLADPRDMDELFKKLRHVEHVKYIKNYGHTELIWAMTAPRLVFDDIISIMRKKLRV